MSGGHKRASRAVNASVPTALFDVVAPLLEQHERARVARNATRPAGAPLEPPTSWSTLLRAGAEAWLQAQGIEAPEAPERPHVAALRARARG